MALYANPEKLLMHLSDWKTGWEQEPESDQKAWTLTAIDYFTNLVKVCSNTEIPSYSEIKEEVIDDFTEALCEAFSEQSGELRLDGKYFDILTLDKTIEVLMEIAKQTKEN